jgi:hypothetical protein
MSENDEKNAENENSEDTKMSPARRSILVDNMQEDLENAGLNKLDPKHVDLAPPRIKWGELYKNFNEAEKVEYLEKIASAMNHAAYQVQLERDELLKLCELKEKQIHQLGHDMRNNNGMIQSEIMKVNDERQAFNKHVAELNQQIKDLTQQVDELKNNDGG